MSKPDGGEPAGGVADPRLVSAEQDRVTEGVGKVLLEKIPFRRLGALLRPS